LSEVRGREVLVYSGCITATPRDTLGLLRRPELRGRSALTKPVPASGGEQLVHRKLAGLASSARLRVHDSGERART